MSNPDFAHIQNWVFDLDNTLYPPSRDLFALIDVRMTGFIQTLLNIDKNAAFSLQKKYLMEYGTTLNGLMGEHNINPDDFLNYVHDIDASKLAPDTALNEALNAFSGKKYIFTNGTVQHAENICTHLGILPHFTDIFDIRAGDYVPKPHPPVYDKMLTQFGIDADATAFFEDMARNLPPAAELGMTTIWLRPPLAHDAPKHVKFSHKGAQESIKAGHIDYVIDALVPFLHSIT